MTISSRCLWATLALVWVASCGSSGNARLIDAGSAGGSARTGGTTGGGGTVSTAPSGGSTASGGRSAAGGALASGGSTYGSGGAGGRTALDGSIGAGGAAGGSGGTTAAKDAGAEDGDAPIGTCGYRGDSCASRPCCGPLVCLSLSNPPSCYESYPPPVDSGGDRSDTGASRDTPLVVDGRSDSSAGCGLPEGCTDGGASTPCPSTPPAEGGACVGQASCFYDVCPSSGRTQATCTAGKWAVSTGPCGQVTCQGAYAGTTPCPSGQVCLAKVGGAFLVSCIANPCGTGPASADCSTETNGCTPMFSIASGVTYYCNTCPAGQLCP